MNEETQEVLERVSSSVNRLKRTNVDLTEISRLQYELEEKGGEEVINVKQVYEDIMADIRHSSLFKECFIQTDFQVYQLMFSKKNFTSILYNLLSNAIKYQSPERGCIIEIHTRPQEPYVVLSVKDNRLGMSQTQQEHFIPCLSVFMTTWKARVLAYLWSNV